MPRSWRIEWDLELVKLPDTVAGAGVLALGYNDARYTTLNYDYLLVLRDITRSARGEAVTFSHKMLGRLDFSGV